MSRYTYTIDELRESGVDIFGFEYELKGENKNVLENYILEAFSDREICYREVDRWLRKFKLRFLEAVDKRNSLYETTLIGFDPLVTDLMRTANASKEKRTNDREYTSLNQLRDAIANRATGRDTTIATGKYDGDGTTHGDTTGDMTNSGNETSYGDSDGTKHTEGTKDATTSGTSKDSQTTTEHTEGETDGTSSTTGHSDRNYSDKLVESGNERTWDLDTPQSRSDTWENGYATNVANKSTSHTADKTGNETIDSTESRTDHATNKSDTNGTQNSTGETTGQSHESTSGDETTHEDHRDIKDTTGQEHTTGSTDGNYTDHNETLNQSLGDTYNTSNSEQARLSASGGNESYDQKNRLVSHQTFKGRSFRCRHLSTT